MLAVEEGVHDGQVRVSTAMQRHFIHHLPASLAYCESARFVTKLRLLQFNVPDLTHSSGSPFSLTTVHASRIRVRTDTGPFSAVEIALSIASISSVSYYL